MLALFLTLFHSEKLSLRSRVLSLRFRYACARIYSRSRSVRVRGFIRVYYVHICMPICECVCVNDARTMALNWRLTGEQ